MSTDNNEIPQFKAFVAAQARIAKLLADVHEEGGGSPMGTSQVYLTGKIAEGLALIFSKDITAVGNWHNLESSITLGKAIAAYDEGHVTPAGTCDE